MWGGHPYRTIHLGVTSPGHRWPSRGRSAEIFGPRCPRLDRGEQMRKFASARLWGATLVVSVTLLGVSGGTVGAAGGPITIVTYGDITGLAPVPEHQFQDGVVAAVNAFNASGGVQGRKIKLITCDTKFQGAAAAACVANAKSEGVVAA